MRALVALFVCLTWVIPVLAAPASQTQRISLDLEDGPIDVVAASFARMTDSELRLDPGVAGTVTLEVRSVSWMTALDAVCESAGCSWRLTGGQPRLLEIQPTQLSPGSGPERRIDLAAEGQPADRLLRQIAQQAGMQLSMEGEVTQPVSLTLRGVSARVALDALCQGVGCRWRQEGSTILLSVPPRETGDPTDPVNLSLRDASAQDVLRSFGKILGGEVEIDPAVQGVVTVELQQVPVAEALRQVCRLVGCSWSLETEPSGQRRLVVVAQ